MDMELDYADIAERYRTLRMYHHPIPEEEAEIVDGLAARLEELLAKARLRDRQLGPVKRKFTNVTEGEVREFAERASEVQADFEKNGPGAPGIDMEEGLVRLEQYTALVGDILKRREELALAQKLFNMAVQSYPEIAAVEQTLKKLQALYELYKEQRDVKGSWSDILWSELDLAVLERGMEGFQGQLASLQRLYGEEIKHDRRTGNTYKLLEEAILGFLNSLPLIQNLKSEALRDRHWKKLMEITGVAFDMNPKVHLAAPRALVRRPGGCCCHRGIVSSRSAACGSTLGPAVRSPRRTPPSRRPCFPLADVHARQALFDAARKVRGPDRRDDECGGQGADDRARHQRHRRHVARHAL